MLEINQPAIASELILKTIERLDKCDLGSPGPLIHTLEKLSGYESHLIKSLARKPTLLSLWALNRIINATSELKKKEQLLILMRQVITHPMASAEAKEEARQFLQFQTRA